MALFVSNLQLTASGSIQGTGDDGIYRDGDWTIAQPCSLPVREFPFKGEGDAVTFRLRQRFQQDVRNFRAAAIGTKHPTYPNAILTGESAQEDKGQYIIEWERQYATIPLYRRVPQSYVFAFQFLVLASGSPATLGERPKSVNSYVIREYFRRAQIDQFPLLERPEYFPLGNDLFKSGTGDLHLAPGTTVFVSNDAEILAEDDAYEDWDGDIMCRRRRVIKGPTLDFWGTIFTP